MVNKLITEVLEKYNIDSTLVSYKTITHGYINDTYLIFLEGEPKFVLQQLNTSIFKKVEMLQQNIDRATSLLYNEQYSRLDFLRSSNGNTLVKYNDRYWRMMHYIPDSITFNTTNDECIAFEAGRIIGTFHRLLEKEATTAYHVTIPNFHDYKVRYKEFTSALEIANAKVVSSAKDAIKFVNDNIEHFDTLEMSDLAIRICHNDTKLNNILFGADKKALCLIDLDTLMPGYFIYDFGDLVRTVVNPVEEDEKNLSKVKFNFNLFEKIVDGLHFSKMQLSDKELEYLPIGVALMPFLHGLRFLTDFLSGNIYYKVNYSDQNLDRCLSLFKFAALAFKHKGQMKFYLKMKLNNKGTI
ncbi:MAG: aminoglycoside phosphotransferase family protein [Bacteroidia bacterium]|nr:aminoglycoside phosphotransferase family protein [Bacteroidia bacterium]